MSPKSSEFGKLGEDVIGVNTNGGGVISSTHCSTVERLYAWEKKLYLEVKVCVCVCLLHCYLSQYTPLLHPACGVNFHIEVVFALS